MKLIAGVVSFVAAKEVYVIGGAEVEAHSEPHILSLQRSGSHFCGGTVVSATHGITASHCYYNPAIVTAVAGAHNIKRAEASQQKAPLTQFKKHPQYNSNTIKNDIAVLEFTNSLTLNEYVVPMCPPPAQSAEWMVKDQTMRVCGWGNTQVIGSNYPAQLHCVNTKYVEQSVCNARNHYNGQILAGMFCAGEVGEGGKDACQGDSGGPVTTEVDGNTVVVGATSWGIGCAYPNYPGVYTDVAMFRDWLNGELAGIDNCA